jgi:hypothetical protein
VPRDNNIIGFRKIDLTENRGFTDHNETQVPKNRSYNPAFEGNISAIMPYLSICENQSNPH